MSKVQFAVDQRQQGTLVAGVARGARTNRTRSRAMMFEDEPVPGYPLPILPGHTSPGRFERVLRAGGFAVTTELAPPDSADPEDVYRRARVFDGYVDAINATDGSGANCHMSSLAVCALADARGLCAHHADLLPRQESHRHPGRYPGRRRHGRVQHALPDRRWRAGGRSSAGQAGVRSGLRVAARYRAHAARRASFPERPQDQLRAARVSRRRGESLRRCRMPGAPQRLAKKVAAGAQFIQTQYCYDLPLLRSFMEQVEALGLLGKVFILAGVGPLRSAKTAEWMRKNVPGMHVPDALIARLERRAGPGARRAAISASSSSRRCAKSAASAACTSWPTARKNRWRRSSIAPAFFKGARPGFPSATPRNPSHRTAS